MKQEAESTLRVEETWASGTSVYTCQATNLQGTGFATTFVHVTRSLRVSPTPS